MASILEFLAIRGENDAVIEALRAQSTENELYRQGVEELATVVSYLRRFGVEESAFIIDLTIARGLDYYTGTVFETMLNDYPSMGSVCSGGRYDSLAEYYTDQKLPGIGISIGLTRLFYQLKENGLIPQTGACLARCLVIPMSDVQLGAALTAASAIRDAGIPADVYYQNKGMKQKMKYAAKIGVPYAAIIGEDEAASGTVMLKDMAEGTQRAVSVSELADAVR